MFNKRLLILNLARSEWKALADPGMGARDARPLSVQILLSSLSFRQKSCQIIGFARNSSPIPIPHLGNPGSATVYKSYLITRHL